jgi:hypothetical protein
MSTVNTRAAVDETQMMTHWFRSHATPAHRRCGALVLVEEFRRRARQQRKLSRRYSARNAVAGSTSAALSAGTTHARHAIEPSASVVTANVAVSCGCTP